MPIAAPIVIAAIVSSGAAAAGTVYASRKQGEAADEAANSATSAARIQAQAQAEATAASTRAATEALNFQKQVYNQRMAALAPYRNVGTNAFSSLAKGFGLPEGSSAQANPEPLALSPLAPQPAQPVSTPDTIHTMKQPFTDKTFTTNDMTGVTTLSGPTTQMQNGEAGSSSNTNMSSLGQPDRPGMVTVVSPDGKERRSVPIGEVDYWLSKGARRG